MKLAPIIEGANFQSQVWEDFRREDPLTIILIQNSEVAKFAVQ